MRHDQDRYPEQGSETGEAPSYFRGRHEAEGQPPQDSPMAISEVPAGQLIRPQRDLKVERQRFRRLMLATNHLRTHPVGAALLMDRGYEKRAR